MCFLGSGGFGQVYKARHRLDGKDYAVKKICVRPNRLEKIRQHLKEVQTLAKFDHTNIVTYKGAWIEKSLPAVLPYIQERQRQLSETSRITNSRRSRSCTRSSIKSVFTRRSESNIRESACSSNSQCESLFNHFQSSHKSTRYLSTKSEPKLSFEHEGNTSGSGFSEDIITERLEQLNTTTNIIGRRIEEQVSSRVVEEGDSDIVSFRYDSKDYNSESQNKTSSANDPEFNSSDETEESDYEYAVTNRGICQYNSSVVNK